MLSVTSEIGSEVYLLKTIHHKIVTVRFHCDPMTYFSAQEEAWILYILEPGERE